jgi:hypothetical protein
MMNSGDDGAGCITHLSLVKRQKIINFRKLIVYRQTLFECIFYRQNKKALTGFS